MNEATMEELVNRLRKDLSLSSEQTEKQMLELRVELDRVHLEIVALKTFLGAAYPSFSEQFPQILEKTIQEVDPESD